MNPTTTDGAPANPTTELLASIVESIVPCEPDHAYVVAKGLNVATARVYEGLDEIGGVQCHGSAAAVVRDAKGEPANVLIMVQKSENVFEDLLLPGAPIAGHWARIGEKNTETIYVVTDHASALSINEATGEGVANALYNKNLASVCKSLRARYPDAHLVICAGSGRPQDANASMSLLLEAANQVGAWVAVPKGASTFNELHRKEGLQSVRECIESAEVPSADWEANDDENPVAWPNPIHPAGLMAHATEHIAKYLVLQRVAIIAVMLWALFTYVVSVMRVAPMLAVLSAIKGCGKTSLIGVLTELVYRPAAQANITSAALFRIIEAENPTLMLDEAERWLGSSEDLTALMNAGHTKQTAYVTRVGKKGELQKFRTFGAKLFAQRGDADETLMDRSIVIRLERKRMDEKTMKYREGEDQELAAIRSQMERFAADNIDAIMHARPSLPDLGNDRAEDNWESLFAVASCGGSAWLAAASESAISLTSNQTSSRSTLEELLTDLQSLFRSEGKVRLTTSAIIAGLSADAERPWLTYSRGRQITARDLAKILKEVNVRSRQLRVGLTSLKAYFLDDLEDAFSRYASPASN